MIRNFIYLDSEKLRSLSSQLFQGVAEQVVLKKNEKKGGTESQKGELGSGRIIGEIFSDERSSEEFRFLEDHAYTLFEEELFTKGVVDEFKQSDSDEAGAKNFVKVVGNLHLNDLTKSVTMLREFNQIGEALWRVTNDPFELGKKITPDADARKRAGEQGLQANQKVTDAAGKLLDFGFGGILEANFPIGRSVYSAPLKREFLRDNEHLLISKYSRMTQGEFSLLGIVTQRGDQKVPDAIIPDVATGDGIKEALRIFARHVSVVEEQFSAPNANEIIVDPIAIYSVL